MNNENLLQAVERLWAGMGSATATALRITVILIAAWVVVALLRRTIRAFRDRVASRLDDREALKRAETIARVFRYLVTVVVSLIAGMLVLGELGVSVAPILGAAEQLGEHALLVNPYDTQGTADAIQHALRMPIDERRARHTRLLAQIRTNDVHRWQRDFLQTLKEDPPT